MFGEKQIEFLKKKKYLKNNETIVDRINTIISVVDKYKDKYGDDLSKRIKVLIENQILCLSTPQLSNLGRYSEKGSSPLNCSCNIITVPNSIQGIYYSIGETAMLSKLGAGVGANFKNVVNKGTLLEEGFYSNPKLDWIEDLVRTSQKVSQGSVRRGYSVPFISIEDPELDELLKRTDKKNSNSNDPFVDNNIGVILPRGFRDKVKSGDKSAQAKFLKILKLREEKGKIYILDEENANKNTSLVYTKLGHNVDSTNICTEALTPSYDDMTFTCMLTSLNLKHWDIIEKDPQIIKDTIYFLDIMVEEYINLTEGIPFLEKARRSAINKRDIGLGTMGFHEYLQSKMLAYGDIGSRAVNKKIYSTIQKYAIEASEELAIKLEPAPMCVEADLIQRNVSLMMVAPNKSTSFIHDNTSLGIEAYLSNYFVKELAGIQTTFRNPYLTKLLESKDNNTPEVWDSILQNLGSVQHLDCLNEQEKTVFLTANEISPKDIIDLASDRQVYIDMGQSLNLFNRPNYSLQDIYDIHMYAFDKGIKTLYYYYPQGHSSIEKVGESWDTCVSCAD